MSRTKLDFQSKMERVIPSNQTLEQLSKQVENANCQIRQLAFDFKGIGGWLSKKDVMRFFDYGATQLRQIEPHLRCAKIGRRKFYQIASIEQFLNSNIQ
jgi:hypothetical protein